MIRYVTALFVCATVIAVLASLAGNWHAGFQFDSGEPTPLMHVAADVAAVRR